MENDKRAYARSTKGVKKLRLSAHRMKRKGGHLKKYWAKRKGIDLDENVNESKTSKQTGMSLSHQAELSNTEPQERAKRKRRDISEKGNDSQGSKQTEMSLSHQAELSGTESQERESKKLCSFKPKITTASVIAKVKRQVKIPEIIEYDSLQPSGSGNDDVTRELFEDYKLFKVNNNLDVLPGRRVVDISSLFRQIWAMNEHSGPDSCNISHMVLQNELRQGVTSTLCFCCQICKVKCYIDTADCRGLMRDLLPELENLKNPEKINRILSCINLPVPK